MSEISLNDDDVVCVSPSQSFAKTSTSKMSELRQAMAFEWIKGVGDWLGDGVRGSALLAKGGGWQTGKFRLRIEFIPDQPKPDVPLPPQPESPLDDLRASLD